jgi:hypothetical protein
VCSSAQRCARAARCAVACCCVRCGLCAVHTQEPRWCLRQAVLRVLLEGMPAGVRTALAPTALLEAARMGHAEAVEAFRAAGVGLRDPSAPSLRVRRERTKERTHTPSVEYRVLSI